MNPVANAVFSYILRPAIAAALCALIAAVVQDSSTGYKQLSLAAPTLLALLVALPGFNRTVFVLAGYAGAATFGCAVAAFDVADTVTRYDLTFFVEWAVISLASGFPVWGIGKLWGTTSDIRDTVDWVVETQHHQARQRERELLDSLMAAPAAAGLSTAGEPQLLPGSGHDARKSDPPTTVEPGPPLASDFSAQELVAGIEAYQLNGEPWWKCDESMVVVQYRDAAQLDIERRVVPAYGWRVVDSPIAPGLRVERKKGLFSLSFGVGNLPEGDLVVTWTKS